MREDSTPIRTRFAPICRQIVAAAAAVAIGLGSATASGAAGEHPRIAAEWEPALGALVVWPPVVPDELLVEIAEDDRLFLIVADLEQREEATARLTELGVDLESVELIVDPTLDGENWTRDWGPSALFDANANYHLLDPTFNGYPMALPDCEGRLYDLLGLIPFLNEWIPGGSTDLNADSLAEVLGVSTVKLPFGLTGGNALVDGLGTAFSTCVMLKENRDWFGLSESEFRQAVAARLGLHRYVVVPNFEWFGIQHIDCLLKPLDAETLLVKRVPEGHPDHRPTEAIVALLSELKTPYGRPYRIVRIDAAPYYMGHHVANYTNALILNRKIFVPLFGVDTDERALATLREAMPGYEVIGYAYEDVMGWAWYDALHCRVRAVWDPKMLYMAHQQIRGRVKPADSHRVDVLIRDYSRAGLIADELKLSWRVRGKTNWNEVALTAGATPETYTASIPAPAATAIEYFLSAADRSGRRETLPRVAPEGVYSFEVAVH
ncbi:MAG: agmatine deiminase family protein [Deltaproteobacteria bacterium]|jgi:agmatine/peptidylarginine deiminase|nr:agmatine deiminase family protein [Deltaproteobacteria bacterium]